MRGIKHIKINSCGNCGNCSDCCTEYSESYSDLNRCGTGGDPNHDHDNRYYTKTQIDNSFYTKDQIDENHYTKSEVYTKEEVYTKSEINDGNFLNGLNALVFWSALKEYKEGDKVVVLTTTSETHYVALQDNVNVPPSSDDQIWEKVFTALDHTESLHTKVITTDLITVNSDTHVIQLSKDNIAYYDIENNKGFIVTDAAFHVATASITMISDNHITIGSRFEDVTISGGNNLILSLSNFNAGLVINDNETTFSGNVPRVQSVLLTEELVSNSLVHKQYVDDSIVASSMRAGRNIQLENKIIHLNALGVPSTLLMLTDTGALNNANGYLRIRENDAELRGKNYSSLTVRGEKPLTGAPIIQARVDATNLDNPEFAVIDYDENGNGFQVAKFGKRFSRILARDLEIDFISSTINSTDPILAGLPITQWKFGSAATNPYIMMTHGKLGNTETGTGEDLIKYIQLYNNGGAISINPNELGFYRNGGRILIVDNGGLIIKPGKSTNNLSILTEDTAAAGEKSFLVTAGSTSGLFYELDTHRIDFMAEEKQNKFIPSVGDVKELIQSNAFNIGRNLFLDENNNLSLGITDPLQDTVMISSSGSNTYDDVATLSLGTFLHNNFLNAIAGVSVSSEGNSGIYTLQSSSSGVNFIISLQDTEGTRSIVFDTTSGLHYRVNEGVDFEDLIPSSLITLQHANELVSLKKDGDGFTLDILGGVTEHLPTGRDSLNLQRNFATTQGVEGTESMVIGRSNTLYGNASLMAGHDNTVEYQSSPIAGAYASLIFGNNNALGIINNSIVGGNSNKVSAPSSGYSSSISNSIVLGSSNTVSSVSNSVVIGNSNTVTTGSLAYVFGNNNTSTSNAIMLGHDNTIGGGAFSMGLGQGLTTAGAYGITVGYHNDASEVLTTGGGAPVVFQIGAGPYASSKKNALSVDYVGNTHINSLYIRNKANTAWNRLDILDSLPTFTNTAIATGMHYMEVIGALQGQIDDLKLRLDTLEG